MNYTRHNALIGQYSELFCQYKFKEMGFEAYKDESNQECDILVIFKNKPLRIQVKSSTTRLINSGGQEYVSFGIKRNTKTKSSYSKCDYFMFCHIDDFKVTNFWFIPAKIINSKKGSTLNVAFNGVHNEYKNKLNLNFFNYF